MRIRDFANITKLEITFLIIIVAITGFLAAPLSLSKIFIIIPLVISGALASMSASVLNNIYDMDIDRKMNRTARRIPILNENSRSIFLFMAIIFLALSVFISLYFINALTMVLIVGGFLSYLFLYTIFLKRRTVWNIVIGGIAGSFPALAGWSSVMNDISLTSVFIALLVFVWTPTHFWSLASSNTEDYIRADIPMLPAVKGREKGAEWIVGNTTIMIIYSYIPLLVHSIHVGYPYYFVVTAMNIILTINVVNIYRSGFKDKAFMGTFHVSNMYLLLALVSIWFVIL